MQSVDWFTSSINSSSYFCFCLKGVILTRSSNMTCPTWNVVKFCWAMFLSLNFTLHQGSLRAYCKNPHKLQLNFAPPLQQCLSRRWPRFPRWLASWGQPDMKNKENLDLYLSEKCFTVGLLLVRIRIYTYMDIYIYIYTCICILYEGTAIKMKIW